MSKYPSPSTGAGPRVTAQEVLAQEKGEWTIKRGPKIRKVRVPEKHHFHRWEHPPVSAVPLPGADPRPEDYRLAVPALREDPEAKEQGSEDLHAPREDALREGVSNEDATPGGAVEGHGPGPENPVFVPRPRSVRREEEPADPRKQCPYCELPNAAGAQACETCRTPLR